MLRLFGPLIVDPVALLNLIEAPPATARRTLVLVSKLIQNLANGYVLSPLKQRTPFKEAHMMELNVFIEQNKERFKNWVDQISQPANEPKEVAEGLGTEGSFPSHANSSLQELFFPLLWNL